MFMLIVVGLILALFVAWNVIPSMREKMRGWTTVIEGLVGTAMTYFGMFADALQEATSVGMIPMSIEGAVPALVCAWIILKRFTTTSPIGKSY